MFLLLRLALVIVTSLASPEASTRRSPVACIEACGTEISDASFRCVDRCMR
jgi:hypothetical protein